MPIMKEANELVAIFVASLSEVPHSRAAGHLIL
jgi:hypothetical protein